MTLTQRLISPLLAVLLSACINLPEVEAPETPDAGPTPDSGVPADTTPPTISATSPANGSSNVATNVQLVVTFSEPMDVSTVQYSLVPAEALSAAAWSAGNTQLALQPTAPLARSTNYTLTVEGKDVAGNALASAKAFSFSTAEPVPDTTPPTVVGASPADTSIGVARNASITVVFSEPMDKTSAQTAFAITSPSGFNAGFFDWNPAGTEMTFNPDSDFPYGTDVVWRVSTAAKDAAANTLVSTASGTFRTIRVATKTIVFDPETSGSALAPDYYKDSSAYHSADVGDYGEPNFFRLFLGFNLEALPENLVAIEQATLKWHVTSQINDPFGTLGPLLLEQVYIGDKIALTPESGPLNPQTKIQYESPALASPITITPNAVGAGINATLFVASDWAERTSRNKRSQFRLRFEIPNNNDGKTNRLTSDWEVTPTLADLEVTYEYP
jgi:hypothetical protein